MTGMERIIERILADAKEQARETLERAQEEGRLRAEHYAAEADAVRDRIVEHAVQEGERIITRARSEAAMTRSAILVAARRRLIDEAFENAKKEICDTDYGKYRELLVALLSCALIEQAEAEQRSLALGDEVDAIEAYEVCMNANDRARFGEDVIRLARAVCERRIGADRAARICLSGEDAAIDGGLLLRFGAVEINCALSVVIAEVRRELEDTVADILFGQEEPSEGECDRT